MYEDLKCLSFSDSDEVDELRHDQLIEYCHVCRCPDGGGCVVLQESPRGGEDDAVRHGPGLIEDARRHRMSGPKRQVREKSSLS